MSWLTGSFVMCRSRVRIPQFAQIEGCLIDKFLCLNLNIIFYETSYCDLLCIDVFWGSRNGTSPIIEGHFEFIEGKGCGLNFRIFKELGTTWSLLAK